MLHLSRSTPAAALQTLEAGGFAPNAVHFAFVVSLRIEQKPLFVIAEQVWFAPPSVVHTF